MEKHLPTMWETWVQSLGWEDLREKKMATHSSTLGWKTPWTEEPGRLQSMGSQRVRHNSATSLSLCTFKNLIFSTHFHLGVLLGSSPSRIQGNPQDERHRRMRERVRQSLGLSLKFIFARLLYTLNNIFGGSAYCLHTGHLKTLQQLDLHQKLDVTHILFVHKSLSYHLAFRPANILWLAPGVT